MPPPARQSESGREGREMAACCRGIRAAKGKDGLERNQWTVLSREQEGINWVINKKLARHEHPKSSLTNLWIQLERDTNLNSVKVEFEPFLEKVERVLEVTGEWIQCSRRGPSWSCRPSFCGFKIISRLPTSCRYCSANFVRGAMHMVLCFCEQAVEFMEAASQRTSNG